ncbi:hypothetical protein BGX26_012708 [Mortierella sp. AD094]|nr:hypothetical protein BGX26_012708 [Mortierella sp. AD094]
MDRQSSNTSTESHTPDPFTDPNPPKDGTRQTAAKAVALPLAAVGGAIAEATRKIGELEFKILTRSNRLHHRTQHKSKHHISTRLETLQLLPQRLRLTRDNPSRISAIRKNSESVKSR